MIAIAQEVQGVEHENTLLVRTLLIECDCVMLECGGYEQLTNTELALRCYTYHKMGYWCLVFLQIC